jgi:hypothetical protein
MLKRLSLMRNRLRLRIKRLLLERSMKPQRRIGKTFKLSLSLTKRRNLSFALIPLVKTESLLMNRSVSLLRLPRTLKTHGRNSKMTRLQQIETSESLLTLLTRSG